jgi:hypothetical protein
MQVVLISAVDLPQLGLVDSFAGIFMDRWGIVKSKKRHGLHIISVG